MVHHKSTARNSLSTLFLKSGFGAFKVALIALLGQIKPCLNAPRDFYMVYLAGVGFAAYTSWSFGGNLLRAVINKRYGIFNLAMGGCLIYTAIARLH